MADMEKAHFAGSESPVYGDSPHGSHHIDTKEVQAAEAVDIFGDAAMAEDYGYVQRGLKSRHVQFIALGGTIGTGLFVGIGKALTQSGPLSLLLGYTASGIAAWAMMQCLGEMATWLPLPGAIPQFCARYVDGALGFAVGWNNWYQAAITQCVEISAASIVIQYWDGAKDINVAAWISILIVLIICLNIFAVSVYGEAEFIFSSIKILTIVGLLFMSLILICGGGPTKHAYGFYTWQNPGAMREYYTDGNLGRFLGLFATLVNAAFSYAGIETVAVAAGEAENPRKNVPKAVRRVFWRILFFYVLGSLAIGCLVPYDDEFLLAAQSAGDAGAAQSPWVRAIVISQIPILPSIINAVILTSASSSANAFLYVGSRYLYALAQNGQAPRFLLRCTKKGVPYWAVLITWAFSALTYLSASNGSSVVFQWFANLTTIATLFTWCGVCVAYIRFHAACKAQGVDRNTMIFKSPFQPYTAWASLIFFSIIIVFNGFYVFGEKQSDDDGNLILTPGGWPEREFSVDDFITAYIGIPIFFVLYAVWKVLKRTKWLSASEVDLYTGKAALDAMDSSWPEQIPRNFAEKVWFWLC